MTGVKSEAHTHNKATVPLHGKNFARHRVGQAANGMHALSDRLAEVLHAMNRPKWHDAALSPGQAADVLDRTKAEARHYLDHLDAAAAALRHQEEGNRRDAA